MLQKPLVKSFLVKITELPLARIKGMLKNADPDWKGGTADAHYLLVLAGERFCKQLSAQTFEHIRTTGKVFNHLK